MSTHEDSTTNPFEQARQLSIEVSRREALTTAAKFGLGGAAFAAALAGGGDVTRALAASRDAKLSANNNFVFVNHATTNQFFVPTKNGAQDACDLLGSKYQWTGSATSNQRVGHGARGAKRHQRQRRWYRRLADRYSGV